MQISIAASRTHVNMVQHAKKLMVVLDMFVNVQLVTKDRFATVRLIFIYLISQAFVNRILIDTRSVLRQVRCEYKSYEHKSDSSM